MSHFFSSSFFSLVRARFEFVFGDRAWKCGGDVGSLTPRFSASMWIQLTLALVDNTCVKVQFVVVVAVVVVEVLPLPLLLPPLLLQLLQLLLPQPRRH